MLEIFQLVRQSVAVFGKKLPENKKSTLSTLGREVARNLGGGCRNEAILVTFAKLSLPLNPDAATWIRGDIDSRRNMSFLPEASALKTDGRYCVGECL